MELLFLGTAAAEGIPSMYCNCDTCKIARIKKGKNIRNRSAVLINKDLCVDFGPDIFYAATKNNVNLSELKNLLVTHSHFDHFYPENLEIRSRRYLKGKTEKLNIIANPAVFMKLSMLGYSDEAINVSRMNAEKYEEIGCAPYKILPVPANHAHEFGGALNYIISDGTASVLYATDTGIYAEKEFEQLREKNLDAVVLDGTNLFSTTSKNHLNVEGVCKMRDLMKKYGVIKNNALVILTHFSHEGIPMQEILDEQVKEFGLIAAYDGLRVNI